MQNTVFSKRKKTLDRITKPSIYYIPNPTKPFRLSISIASMGHGRQIKEERESLLPLKVRGSKGNNMESTISPPHDGVHVQTSYPGLS